MLWFQKTQHQSLNQMIVIHHSTFPKFDFLNHIDEKKIKEQADFLFFLKQFWYPHTSSEYQLFFNKVYREDIIYKNASSYLWIQKNRKNYQKLMSHIRGKLTVKQFFKNIIFALTEGRHITFSQN